MSRMKLQVLWEAVTSLGFALPCRSLSSHKLPWVTGRWALRAGLEWDKASRQALCLTWSPLQSPTTTRRSPSTIASLSSPLLAGPRTTPSLLITTVKKRMRILPTVCHPKKVASPCPHSPTGGTLNIAWGSGNPSDPFVLQI